MICKYYIVVLLVTCLSGVSSAATTPVQFKVNMNYQTEMENFFPSFETVDIAGSFNGWGNPAMVLTDYDEDGVYEITINLTIGTTVEFKFRINGEWNGREEFPGGGPNRAYTVIENGIAEYWYNDEIPSSVLSVKILVSSSTVKPGETVQFTDNSSGNPVEWRWTFPGGEPSTSILQNPAVSYLAEGLYSVTLTITDADEATATKTFTNFIRVDEMQTHWWNDVVFYEIFVRSFKDSDGDGNGDLQGLISKLDYLNDGNPETTTDLGITGIWLMPVQQSPSYHGYDATDYRTIEADFGSNSDFQTFMQEAHNRGIKVIVDFVMNHSSNQHPWFVASTSTVSPYRNWYVWSATNPGTTGPWGQTLWHYNNGSFYYGLFWSGMPDLNYTNPEVKDEMFDVARFWLEDMGVDGFRLDAVKYIIENENSVEDTEETLQFWQDFRTHIKAVNPDAFAVGEAWAATSTAQAYVNNDRLDYCFEFDLASSIIYAVNNGTAAFLGEKLADVMSAYPFLQFGTFLTNHDIDRIMSLLGSNEAKAKVAAGLLLTLPGIPYIYYGEEIGMIGVKPDEKIRTPMQWNSTSQAGFTNGTPWYAVNTDYTDKNVESQQANSNSLWNQYRKFISIRNSEVALRRGNLKTITPPSASVLAFLRQYENENVLVIVNLGFDDMVNISLSLPYAGIDEGTHLMENLSDGSHLPLVVDETGGFSNLIIETIPAQTISVYKIQLVDSSPFNEFFPFDASVFPNPAQNKINVEVLGNISGNVCYSIFDIAGRIIVLSSFYHTVHGERHTIGIEKLSSGLYFIAIEAKSKRKVLRFVVK
jgi:alpha-amylase